MQQPLLQNTTSPIESKADDFNVKDLLFRYLVYWKWIILSVVVCSSLAYIFLRYKEIYYGVNASILIKDEKKGGTSEFSAFSDLNIFAGKNNIENEIAIFKSRGLSQNVVKKLDLDISYFSEGR
ncbi:MAG: Wzz/FepE/Etk N-terminal domain-containing protein, partial [Flavobacterium sp.]